MSKRLPTIQPNASFQAKDGVPIATSPLPSRPAVWRSLAEKSVSSRPVASATDERGLAGAIVEDNLVEGSRLGRRHFLAVGSATAAAVGLSGCLRRPREQILPYSVAPEYSLPGISLHFATSVYHHGDSLGLLVESHEGRPTKIEGNPAHPNSNGMPGARWGHTDAMTQARIWDLYDDNRSRKGRFQEADASWNQFVAWWRERADALEANGGAGLRVLGPPTDSPTFHRVAEALLERFPEARVHFYEPISRAQVLEGARLAFGAPNPSRTDFSAADLVLAIDSDFLAMEANSIRSAREFSAKRALNSPTDPMNRLYVVESTSTVTGMNADHRLRLAPSQIDRYLRALAARLATVELPADATRITLPPEVAAAVQNTDATGFPVAWLDAVARDLLAHRGRCVITVGWRQPAHVHALAHVLNVSLGALGTSLAVFDHAHPEVADPTRSLSALLTDMTAGQVDTLLILGGNPVYDAPGFRDALENVEHTIHVASHLNETSRLAEWHLPEADDLESWGDHRSIQGAYSIQQPLIAPLFGGHSTIEVFARVAGMRPWQGHPLVRGTFQILGGIRGPLFEQTWRQALHRGLAPSPPFPPIRPNLDAPAVAAALVDHAVAPSEAWELSFVPSYQAYDGRHANNPWLLEMPDPVTKLVWDNAAYVSPRSGEALGLDVHIVEERAEMPRSEMITVSADGASITIPVIVVPGHPDHVVTLPLGFGRTAAGDYGNEVGFDVNPLRTLAQLGFRTGVDVTKAVGSYELVQTQDHHTMDARPVVRDVERPLAIDATLEEYREHPNFGQFGEPTPAISPLWTQVDYGQVREPAQGGLTYMPLPERRPANPDGPVRYKWGMAIDLTRCTGCSACIIACQSENNVVTVGKQQVARGREMHWMRIDRYFVGDDVHDPDVALQPVACQHCEEAPCENVCPVAATAHSPEGLNDMAYNRCIGTRYCMNNCPYKVRRFNYLDFHGEIPETRSMQFNPNVTVRMRGVMEKCSYCVQRIQAARIQTRRETTVTTDAIQERRITDGDFTTACAQACPSEAITFGDLNNVQSEVHRMVRIDRQYSLLASIGTQPRTTYLGKIRNPNREMA